MKSSLCALLCATALTATAITGCGTTRQHTATLSQRTPRQDRYVVILSLDGFRPDYQGVVLPPTSMLWIVKGLLVASAPPIPR